MTTGGCGAAAYPQAEGAGVGEVEEVLEQGFRTEGREEEHSLATPKGLEVPKPVKSRDG